MPLSVEKVGADLERREPQWEVHPTLSPSEINRVRQALPDLRLSPLAVQLLANRGVTEPDDIRCFIDPPEIDKLADPLRMVGMVQAVERVRAAIEKREKVVVYGDFDADGVTATALLTHALRFLGANVEPYIPHRVRDGYGLNRYSLKEIAQGAASLVITVDCGISNVEEALYATDKKDGLGLDLIVTDHHELPADLPHVTCINPKQRVDGCEDLEYLAGVGVAYQLVKALIKTYSSLLQNRTGGEVRVLRDYLLGLVAIGTVADMAALRGANRSLVKYGLEALSRHILPGLQALLETARVSAQSMSAERLGFIIGPRLNSAGRIGDASTALNLLLTSDIGEAGRLAALLEEQNRVRQNILAGMMEHAIARVAQMPDGHDLIFLPSGDWPTGDISPLGIVGLVAGKLVDMYGRPSIVLAPVPSTTDPEDAVVGAVAAPDAPVVEFRGSARSVPNFNIHEALTRVKDALSRYGGHTAAAGLTVRADRIEELEMSLRQIAADVKPRPSITADKRVTLEELGEQALADVGLLAPFGGENPQPLFLLEGLYVQEARTVTSGSHLKLFLSDTPGYGGARMWGIAFYMADQYPLYPKGSRVDLLCNLERDDWNGRRGLQLVMRRIRTSRAAGENGSPVPRSREAAPAR